MTIPIVINGQTDVGKVRKNNEDAYFIDAEAGVMIVSDGMGGHQAGEVASRIVVEALPRQIASARLSGGLAEPDVAALTLVQSLGILNEMVFEKGREFTDLANMGATVVAGVVVEDSLVIAHLGDSRAYLLRGGGFERLTKDHNMAELLLDAGVISARQFQNHPGQYQLCRFVGMKDCPGADVGILALQAGDRILMCSDGLSSMVDDRTIGQILLDEPDAAAACHGLIALANDAGGQDNITVAIADVPADGDSACRRDRVKLRRAVGQSLRQPAPRKKQQLSDEGEIILEEWHNE